MPWYSQCSWCGGPFNGGNCRRCTNMSFGEEFVRNPDPISNDETPEFSYPPSQPQTSSLDQRSCFHCGGPLVGDVRCQRCTCKTCGCYLSEGFCRFCKTENSSINPPNDFTHPPQPQYESNSCEKCGNDSHYGYDCSPRFPLVYEQEPCYNQNYSENYYPQNSPSFPPQYLCCTRCGGPHETFQSKRIEREQAANLAVQKEHEEQAAQSFTRYRKFPIFDDDDDEYNIQYKEYLENFSKVITSDLSTEEPFNYLSMGDEHLDTIPETESDEVIKSSVEDFVPIPSESKIDSLLEEFAGELAPLAPIPTGINKAGFDQEEDIRRVEQLLNNSPPLDVLNDHFEIFSDSNDDYTSSDVDYFEDIDYVEALPPDSELVSLEEVEDVILREKLLNIYLLIAKIESLNDNPTQSFLSHSDNSLLEFETFSNHTEETRSDSTTIHAENSLPEYDSFHFEIESNQGELSRVVMETIDEIDVFLDIDVSTDLEDGYHDSEGDIIYLESLLINNTIPNLSPKDCPNFEDSRAWCFVHRSLALKSLACLY
ncbi:hypothetical protein Tco_1314577 [Tanacetum coccineum]